jgi:hypothetical protein
MRILLLAALAVWFSVPARAVSGKDAAASRPSIERLTAEERAQYEELKAKDPAEAAVFLASRQYMIDCQRVLNGELPAARLPKAPQGYQRYITDPDELAAKRQATNLYVKAVLNGAA